ncbi:MAG: sigma 54-interacting transcriptional regulator [Sporolactobacillus sp.]
MAGKAQDKVFDTLKKLMSGHEGGVTASDIAGDLKISRQVTSHYLTQLLVEGHVQKTATKPVYWRVIQSEEKLPSEIAKDEKDPFQAFIGYRGSQHELIEQCKAAVNYPPNGLPLIINGKSGVGKSFLASLIHQYAITKGALEKGAPFIVLNCADYANNPELLSATLFGYKKGAFTGADADKEGLIKQADGGYLFFDEIHRLSHENQEKLFVFMDKGVYRPIGENKNWENSRVRLIFATTEQNDQVLLTTFRRRITVRLHISNLDERPFTERLQLVSIVYQQEAQKINKEIIVSPEALNDLCFCQLEGNVGMLRNLIRLSCAKAFTEQTGAAELRIDRALLSSNSEEKDVLRRQLPPLRIRPDQPLTLSDASYSQPLQKAVDHFFAHLSTIQVTDQAERSALIVEFKRVVSLAVTEGAAPKMIDQFFLQQLADIEGKYGLTLNDEVRKQMSRLFSLFLGHHVQAELPDEQVNKVRLFFPRTCYLAGRLSEKLVPVFDHVPAALEIFYAFFLQESVDEQINLHGIIVAHGSRTATSIQEVTNRLCRTPVFEAMDMPMNTDIKQIVSEIKDYLKQIDTSKGLILLVDMGSLNQLYSSIKHSLKSDLLVINNLTTAVALDIGMKMVQNLPFRTIAEQAKKGYKIEARYFEGLTQGSNIIISCMSGVGISNRVKEIMARYIPADRLDILTMDYKELRDAIKRNDRSYFKQTQFIITTTELPEALDIFNINIFEILEERGQLILWEHLQPFISETAFKMLLRDILNIFSIEGVSNRLSFLNPQVIIHEVEHVISLYEKYFEITLNGKIKLNLYMHIALMVERLITTRGHLPKEQAAPQTTPKEMEFTAITREIFHEIELKYNIEVNGYELSLLYELMKSFLYQGQD